jgi:1-aminocyclopropane-1-carboxylate deaminase
LELTDLIHPTPSPLQVLPRSDWEARGLRVWIKRDDLLAPAPDDPFCGNKWRKLQHNLVDALTEPPTPTFLSFGGAYSNHIAALASAGRHFGLSTIGVIRGEAVSNPTLDRAHADGMHLHFIDRTAYRQKNNVEFQEELRQRFGGNLQFIPEGGSDIWAFAGCMELASELLTQLAEPPTHVLLACGTGGTLAGLSAGLSTIPTEVYGISVLKGSFLTEAIRQLFEESGVDDPHNWQVLHDFHHGGYAKRPPALIEFIHRFYREFGIRLDPIYTGKAAWALEQLITEDFFPAGSRIVMIHTGGLQGAQDLWG